VREAKVSAADARLHAEARHSCGAAVKALDRAKPEEVAQERLIETIHIGGGRCDAARGIDPRRMRRRREPVRRDSGHTYPGHCLLLRHGQWGDAVDRLLVGCATTRGGRRTQPQGNDYSCEAGGTRLRRDVLTLGSTGVTGLTYRPCREAPRIVAGLKLKLLCHAAARRYRHGESRLRAASWSGRILNQSHIVRKYMTRDCASCVLIAEVLIVDAK
jgi:hypothetical protein